jgi:hypothetical protein
LVSRFLTGQSVRDSQNPEFPVSVRSGKSENGWLPLGLHSNQPLTRRSLLNPLGLLLNQNLTIRQTQQIPIGRFQATRSLPTMLCLFG